MHNTEKYIEKVLRKLLTTGVFVIYFTHKSDMDIENPFGRITAIPAINSETDQDCFYPLAKIYGNVNADDFNKVETIMREHQNYKKDRLITSEDSMYDEYLPNRYYAQPGYTIQTREELVKYVNKKAYGKQTEINLEHDTIHHFDARLFTGTTRVYLSEVKYVTGHKPNMKISISGNPSDMIIENLTCDTLSIISCVNNITITNCNIECIKILDSKCNIRLLNNSLEKLLYFDCDKVIFDDTMTGNEMDIIELTHCKNIYLSTASIKVDTIHLSKVDLSNAVLNVGKVLNQLTIDLNTPPTNLSDLAKIQTNNIKYLNITLPTWIPTYLNDMVYFRPNYTVGTLNIRWDERLMGKLKNPAVLYFPFAQKVLLGLNTTFEIDLPKFPTIKASDYGYTKEFVDFMEAGIIVDDTFDVMKYEKWLGRELTDRETEQISKNFKLK
jgi:hypothetical protein